MSDIPMQADIPVDANGRIDIDLKCVSCGYNIRGLLRDGVCPECGTATARSCGSNHLQFSRPEWVEQLASGMNWIVAAIVIAVLGGLATQAAPPTGPYLAIVILLQIAVPLTSVVGYWKLTTPEPRLPDDPREETLRQVARWSVMGNAVLTVSGLGISGAPTAVSAVFGVVAGVVAIVQTLSIFLYARRLALRIPNADLAKQTAIVMWGIVITTGAGALLLTVALLVASTAGVTMVPLATAGCGVGLGFLVFGLWSLLLIDRYRRNFKEAARLARETWAAAGKPVPAA